MKDFVIISDTTCDLPASYVEKHNLKIVPLCYTLDGVVYGAENQMSIIEFYKHMRDGKMPSTMAGVPEEIKDIFLDCINNGKDILYVCFSSALSSTYNNAMIIANELKEDYPDAKIHVIDSLAAALGEGLLVHKAVIMKEKGASIDEVATWLEENKLNLGHIFTVNDLFHLHRGGRVSKTTAIVGTLINVKPVLHVNDEGRLVSLCNVRGRKKALAALVDKMAELVEGYTGENNDIFIGHGDCLEDAKYVADMVKEKLGFNNIMIDYISPTIGAHAGPGTVALFFMGNHR
ncbi:MAG: DegV family protein [Lachnospiraceae bacterium]|nr:DegV family protein [Lachnospiraceae bacterium]